MLKKRWFGYISAYVFWAISVALALWFLIQVRETLPAWIAGSIMKDPLRARRLATIINQLLVLVGGAGLLVFLLIIEQYFRKGVLKGNLWGRIARVCGILLVLIFLIDGSQLMLNKISLTFWSSWLMVLVELALGVSLLTFSRNRLTRSSNRSRSDRP